MRILIHDLRRYLPAAVASLAAAPGSALFAPGASAGQEAGGRGQEAPDVSGLPPFTEGGLYLGRHEMGLYP